jgi:hypothetical protein
MNQPAIDRCIREQGECARPTLIDNAIPTTEPCRWCDADSQPHTPGCPCGERYGQIQQLGGVPLERWWGGKGKHSLTWEELGERFK